MGALGVLFVVVTALGTHGASEGWVSSPVRHYIGIAILQKMLCTRLMPSTLHTTCVSVDVAYGVVRSVGVNLVWVGGWGCGVCLCKESWGVKVGAERARRFCEHCVLECFGILTYVRRWMAPRAPNQLN